MKKIIAVMKYTFLENFRNRTIYVMFVFSFFVIFSAAIFSQIAGEQEIRIITDSGLATIEIFSFLLSIFISVRLLLAEMESRTLYLVFSRPVERYQYLAGRYLGILAILLFSILVMSGSLSVLLLLKKAFPGMYFAASIAMIFAKVAIISAVSILLSMVSTSSSTALIVSFLVWILGHAVPEMKYLARGMHSAGIKIMLYFMSAVLPNLQALNLKEYHEDMTISVSLLAGNAAYALAYIVVTIGLSVFIFRKKEL